MIKNFFDDNEYSIDLCPSPLDNSFSIMNYNNDTEKSLKDSSEYFMNNSNNMKPNVEGDKECYPAPGPMPSPPYPNDFNNQNELSNSQSHNMECPEVVKNKSDDDFLLTQEQYNTFNEEQLIEKPVDDNDNSNEIENVSAPANFAPKPENTNTQELPCPKNSFTITPMGSKNCQNIFFNFGKTSTKHKSKLTRKLKPDSIRKKIKARLHKKIIKMINKKLKDNGSKLFFDMLPQPFITNINIEFNKPLLNITMRELFQKTFGFKAKDKEKIDYNKKVIKYLEDNPNIDKDEILIKFLDSTYEEIIRKYISGKWILEDIERLKKDGEDLDYINRYYFIAINWIPFYKNGCI